MIVLSTSSLPVALKHPDYVDKIRAAVQPAFAELLRAIQGKKGAVLERADVDQIIRSAVASGGPRKVSLSGTELDKGDFRLAGGLRTGLVSAL